MSFTDVGIIILKCFFMLERNSNKLTRIANEAKQIIHAIDMHDSDYVMNCINTIPSISSSLKKFLVQSD